MADDMYGDKWFCLFLMSCAVCVTIYCSILSIWPKDRFACHVNPNEPHSLVIYVDDPNLITIAVKPYKESKP